MNELKDLARRLTKLREAEGADKITDEAFHNGLSAIEDELNSLASDKPEAAEPEPKQTPCKGCGTFDFKQRYHAIVDSTGYLDEGGYFTATDTDVDEVTQMHDFECISCGKDVEEPDGDEEEDEDEE
jgi:hypothetical protein